MALYLVTLGVNKSHIQHFIIAKFFYLSNGQLQFREKELNIENKVMIILNENSKIYAEYYIKATESQLLKSRLRQPVL